MQCSTRGHICVAAPLAPLPWLKARLFCPHGVQMILVMA